MKIEIWSDVVCPFCYIGKRRLESALAEFPDKEQIEIVWKSFQLDANAAFQEGTNIYKNLADKKGWTEDYAKQVSNQVTEMAKQEGLFFEFEKAIPANTFKAHRLIHFAATHKLQDKAKESLLAAFFVEGKNIEDTDSLINIGLSIGLNKTDLINLFNSEAFTNDVEIDIYDAQQIGVQGVPFFVFDRKYAVSGAQPVEVFLKTLQRSASEAKELKTDAEQNSCSVETPC
jgi:predicted DsbA family dithiol-disulfide isomerase